MTRSAPAVQSPNEQGTEVCSRDGFWRPRMLPVNTPPSPVHPSALAQLVIGIAAKSPSREYNEHDKMQLYQRSPVALRVTGGASINELGSVAAGPFYFSWTSSTRLFFFRPQRSTTIRSTANQFGKTDKMKLRISFSIGHRLFLYRSKLRPRWTSLVSLV